MFCGVFCGCYFFFSRSVNIQRSVVLVIFLFNYIIDVFFHFLDSIAVFIFSNLVVLIRFDRPGGYNEILDRLNVGNKDRLFPGDCLLDNNIHRGFFGSSFAGFFLIVIPGFLFLRLAVIIVLRHIFSEFDSGVCGNHVAFHYNVDCSVSFAVVVNVYSVFTDDIAINPDRCFTVQFPLEILGIIIEIRLEFNTGAFSSIDITGNIYINFTVCIFDFHAVSVQPMIFLVFIVGIVVRTGYFGFNSQPAVNADIHFAFLAFCVYTGGMVVINIVPVPFSLFG